jgi:hypothetical protein
LERGVRGKNNRSRERRGLTLRRIMLYYNKIFRGSCPKGKRNGKNRIRSGAATALS